MYGWEFPPHNSGGLGVACYGLARGLIAEGAQVSFVLPRKMPVGLPGCTFRFADEMHPLDGAQAEQFASGYITEERLAFLRGKFPELQYGPSLYDEVLAYAARSPLIALSERADVIHAHDWLSFPAAIAAKEVTGLPLVAHIHATEFDRTGFGSVNQNVYDIERRGMHEADLVVAVSEYTRGIIIERYGVDPNKVVVVHNAIDPDDTAVHHIPYDSLDRLKEHGWGVVLFVGRLTMQKGPDYFLRAAKKVLEFRRNVIFVVAGSGDMERQIINDAAYHGIADKVLFAGFTRGNELSRLYRLADVVVMPSVSEPFGIVPLEALLNGTPVLLSRQSGVAEVLRSALRVDFWDTDEMANKILGILTYPPLREVLRTHGGAEVRGHLWRTAARKCIMMYERLTRVFASAPSQ